MKLGITLFSLTSEFHSGRYSLEELLEATAAAELGPGLEIMGAQMIRGFPTIDRGTEHSFRTVVEKLGFELAGLDAELELGIRHDRWLTEAEMVEQVSAQLLAAHKLGFPVLKLQHQIPLAVLEQVLPLAERDHVVMGIEIHAPRTVSDEKIVAFQGMFERLDTPYLGFVPDFGVSARAIPPIVLNDFQQLGMPKMMIECITELWDSQRARVVTEEEVAEKIESFGGGEVELSAAMMAMTHFGHQPTSAWSEIMHRVVLVHAKFAELDENGDVPEIDYAAIIRVLVESNYDGYIASEYEGFSWRPDVDAFQMVRNHQDLLRRLLTAENVTS